MSIIRCSDVSLFHRTDLYYGILLYYCMYNDILMHAIQRFVVVYNILFVIIRPMC